MAARFVKTVKIKKLLSLSNKPDKQSCHNAAHKTGNDTDCQRCHSQRCTVYDKLGIQ